MAITPLKPERKVPAGPRSIAAGRRESVVLLPNGEPWMGPGEPQPSSAPEGSERSWAYPVLFNTWSDPVGVKSSESGFAFADLRAFADQVHVRAAIETVKNAQTKKQWLFVLKPKPGESMIQAGERASKDKRISELADFFESPDGEHDFAEWMRMYLEDTLVIDAPCVYNVRRQNGKPYELEIFDGATIRPLIDERGRSPRGDQPAYQQWLYGQPGEFFTRAEMMYAPRNPRSGKVFGKSPVEQLLLYINIALRKDLQRLNTYTEGNIPAGLLPMPVDYKSQDIAQWYASFNTFVKGVAQNQVKIVPIPGGTGQPIFPSLEANKDMWEESWVRLVCFAFDITPAALVREMNRSVAESNRDAAEQDGAASYTDYIRRRLNWIIRNWFGYHDIEAKTKTEIDVEAETQAKIDESEIKLGTLQINEKREREGRPPIPELAGINGYFSSQGFVPFTVALAAPAGEPVDGEPVDGQPAIDGEVPQGTAAGAAAAVASVQLNGAQMAAASNIVLNVASGALPRDSGLNQLQIMLKMTPAEAEMFMGSAGKSDVATTPNPVGGDNEDPDPDPEPPKPPVPPAPREDEDEEAEKAAYDYASTQVNLEGEVASTVLRMAARISDEALHEKGREDTPHITVRFGIDPAVSEDAVRDVLVKSEAARQVAARGGIRVTLGETAHFSGEEYDVVYIAVDSDDLKELNAALRGGLDGVVTFPKYQPHATLAYVKKGSGADYDGMPDLSGTEIVFDAILFSDTEGNLTPIELPAMAEKAAKRVTLNRPELVEKRSKSLTRKLAVFLSDEGAKLAESIASRYEEAIKADEFEIAIEWGEAVSVLTPALEQIYKDGAKAAAKDLGVGPFNQLNARAKEWAETRAAELVGMKWEGGELIPNPNAAMAISETTRGNLRDLVTRALDEGMSPAELKQAILEMTDFSKLRAKRIADYELAAAQNAGSSEAWTESGVVEKKGWLLSADHDEYDGCNVNAEAGEIPFDEPFPSGHMTGPLHPGCKCDVYAVVA